MKILIAGAGIGGLTAAICLLRAGHDVEIYEQAAQLGEAGAGIQLSANASRVLHSIGLEDAIKGIAVQAKSYEFRLYDTGEVLQTIPLGEHHVRQHGSPYYHVHRADFHNLLASKVQSLKTDAIQLDSVAAAYEEDEKVVTLKLADGRMAKGDLLIGADGIKSAIRTQIVGHVSATYTGDIAWRITVPSNLLPANYMDKITAVWVGPGRHAVIYYLRRGELLNFVGLVEFDRWEEESWTTKRPWTDLKADFAGWHQDIQTVIDAADKNECYRWALNNRKPIPNWSSSRATLLGDAAHPTLPYLAQGAVMAIEDGAVLTRALAQCNNVADALSLYQRNRVDRTARIVNESTANRALFHHQTSDEFRQAFSERNIAAERANWLYSYDPLTVPLS